MISKDINLETEDNSDSESVEKQEKLPKKVYIIAQEVKIVKSLAGNDPKQRAKQLRKLRKWLSLRSNSTFPFSDDDFMRIWKGLYYCMWMSDKPLVQEELAEDLGKLTECLADVSSVIKFFGAFLRTMVTEWFGIDQWRMDKFLMLVRRMLRYTLRAMKKANWTEESIVELNTHVFDVVTKNALGLSMHLVDIFFEELAKISEGDISSECVAMFLKPFIKYMAHQKEFKLLAHMRNRIFEHLMHQSDLGREYSEKYAAWREMGFPTSSIDDLEKDDAPGAETGSETKIDSSHLDPRAGNVDVFMPILPVDAKFIIADIEEILYKEETNTKSRKFMKAVLENYKKFQNGEFPLGIKKMPKIETGPLKPLVEEKMASLDNLEDELFSTTRKLKQMNKKKRKRLLAEVNYSEATEENFEKMLEKSLPKTLTGDKKRKPAEDFWLEEEIEVPKKMKKVGKKNKSVETPAPTLFKEKPTKVKKSKKSKLENGEAKAVKSPSKAEDKETSEWGAPLEDGEIEYFVPSRKIALKKANEKLADIVPNPYAINSDGSPKIPKTPKTPKNALLGKNKKSQSIKANKVGFATPTSESKRVKIVLQKNTAQKQSEYLKQVRSSPNLPYDANKKPSKGLLKPNLMPSPINPFYKKKIGLKFNDTL